MCCVDGRKVAGILVEGRLQERWAVVGIGVNVALRAEDFPRELRDRAGTLGREPSAIEPALEALLAGSSAGSPPDGAVLDAVRARDALLRARGTVGRTVGDRRRHRRRRPPRGADGRWASGLDAGEVHLGGA